MSSILIWSKVVRSDRQELVSFECTEPPKSRKFAGRWEKHHPRPWERQVQARVRTMNPPCQPPDFAWVGRDRDGIGAVVFYEELDGPAQVEIHLAAVARRHRRRGGGCADEMMRMLFDALTARALEMGVHQVSVLTWIEEANRPSQAMARRAGMRQMGVLDDTTLQRWAANVLVGGAPIG